MSRSFWAAAHAAVMSPWGLLAKLALCALLGGGSASGAQIIYTSDLYPANGSHVAGNAILTWDTIANTLAVMIHADDLEPNQVHEMHIHGRFDGAGNPIDSVRPTPANDTDADGFVEMMEGSAAIGPVIMPLGSATTDNGIIVFNQTYNLNNDALFFDPHTG